MSVWPVSCSNTDITQFERQKDKEPVFYIGLKSVARSFVCQVDEQIPLGIYSLSIQISRTPTIRPRIPERIFILYMLLSLG